MSMAERLLFTILKGELAYYKADEGQRFERFLLEEQLLDADEAAQARLYFAGGVNGLGNTIEAQPPSLHHGYPRTGGPFPLWAITLGGERDTQTYLGDDAFPVDEDGDLYADPETGAVVDPKIRRVEYTYNILCLADHPDITLYYYYLLKQIILSQREEFIAADLDPPSITGADLAPDPRFLPDHIFARQLTVTIEGEECWPSQRTGGYAREITGLHLDDAETAGGGITTYTAGS